MRTAEKKREQKPPLGDNHKKLSSSGTGRHSTLEQFIRTVAQAQESALLLDYDGTLAPFSADRRQSFPYRGITQMLREIMLSGRTRVVIITGRNAYEVVFLLRIDPIPEVWGSHGLQRLRPDGNCEMPRIDADVSRALADAGQWLAEQRLQPFTEFKPGGVAVHWRGLPESNAAEIREKALRAWLPLAERGHLEVLEFDGGVEIRMRNVDKGDAVRTILNETAAGVPIAYLGDDTTDEDAFQALGNRGMSILVRPEWRGTCAQIWLKPPDEVLDFLTRWWEACRTPKATRSIVPMSDHDRPEK